MNITSKITGMDDVNARINNMLRAPRVKAGVVAPGYNDAGDPIPRYVNAQRKAGRDPFFFDASEDTSAMRILVQMCDAWVSRAAGEFMMKLRALAEKFPEAAKRHIEQQRSVDGPMAPVSERYAAIKKYTRKQGDKILVATGALRDAITSVYHVRAGGR